MELFLVPINPENKTIVTCVVAKKVDELLQNLVTKLPYQRSTLVSALLEKALIDLNLFPEKECINQEAIIELNNLLERIRKKRA